MLAYILSTEKITYVGSFGVKNKKKYPKCWLFAIGNTGQMFFVLLWITVRTSLPIILENVEKRSAKCGILTEKHLFFDQKRGICCLLAVILSTEKITYVASFGVKKKKNIEILTFAIENYEQTISVLLWITVRTSLPIIFTPSKKRSAKSGFSWKTRFFYQKRGFFCLLSVN